MRVHIVPQLAEVLKQAGADGVREGAGQQLIDIMTFIFSIWN
jgi:hypothetical protein